VNTHADRPHRHASTETLKGALALVSVDAQQVAQTGPKKHENALHEVANQFLDELQHRGEL
jgi:hypothetical protein